MVVLGFFNPAQTPCWNSFRYSEAGIKAMIDYIDGKCRTTTTQDNTSHQK